MSLMINNKSIQRVMVVDDQPASRDAMAYSLEDAELEPIFHKAPFTSMTECLSTVTTTDAAIFDHHLKPGNYANFDGAEAVAQLYKQRFPSLLITKFAETDVDNIRPFRRNIPVIILSEEASSETITGGIKQCLEEFENHYSTERRPWRTLLEIEEVNRESNVVYAIIPGWHPDKLVRFPLVMFPENFWPLVVADAYFFAKVNVGATHQNQLYFQDFEVAEAPGEEYAKFVHS